MRGWLKDCGLPGAYGSDALVRDAIATYYAGGTARFLSDTEGL